MSIRQFSGDAIKIGTNFTVLNRNLTAKNFYFKNSLGYFPRKTPQLFFFPSIHWILDYFNFIFLLKKKKQLELLFEFRVGVFDRQRHFYHGDSTRN